MPSSSQKCQQQFGQILSCSAFQVRKTTLGSVKSENYRLLNYLFLFLKELKIQFSQTSLLESCHQATEESSREISTGKESKEKWVLAP